jgi:hypothetical protein
MAAQDTMGTMASYAATGNSIAPGIGAVVGGIVGGISAIFSSTSQASEAKRLLKKIQSQQKVIGRSISKSGEGYQAATAIADSQYERGKQELEKQLETTTQATMSSFDVASASSGFDKSGQLDEMFSTQTENIQFAEEKGLTSLQDKLYQSLAQASTQMAGTRSEGLNAITELEAEREQYSQMDTWQENFFG